jgi:hypothetical protein
MGIFFPYMVNTGLNNASLVSNVLSIRFFVLLIHYIIGWYAQISWTPTYHITVPAARRVSCASDHKPTISSTVPHIYILLSLFISDFEIRPQDHKPTSNEKQI